MESCVHFKSSSKSSEFHNKFRLICTLIHSHRIDLEELSYAKVNISVNLYIANNFFNQLLNF